MDSLDPLPLWKLSSERAPVWQDYTYGGTLELRSFLQKLSSTALGGKEGPSAPILHTGLLHGARMHSSHVVLRL